MQDYFIDFLVAVLFFSISRMFWIYSKIRKTSQGKLLFKAISFFVLLHLILFPVIYSVMINNAPKSIQIAENIFSYEKGIKLQEAIKARKNIEYTINDKKQKNIINNIIEKNRKVLSNTTWEEIDDKKIINLDTQTLLGYTKYREIPSDEVQKIFEVYDLKGSKYIEFGTTSQKQLLSDILNDYLIELDSEKHKIDNQIERIESNSFWSYRQVLPYTINILFTSNFNPQSKIANIIFFFHNILVVGFLLTFIVGFFQHYLVTKIESK